MSSAKLTTSVGGREVDLEYEERADDPFSVGWYDSERGVWVRVRARDSDDIRRLAKRLNQLADFADMEDDR